MRLTPKRLQRIPHAPGIYTFVKRGRPIYVGKAADLRARITAYTPEKDCPSTSLRVDSLRESRMANMVREATGLQIERTDSELEALLLEANRIKTFRPKYNIANRDQKSFLSILITDEEFPQVLPTRSHVRAGTYFGPFTSAHAVRETLRALRKIFPYRCKSKPRYYSHTRTLAYSHTRPCLYFHLGQCAGTCAGLITAADYRRRVIAPLTRILSGHAKSARRLLDAEHRKLLAHVLAHTRVLSVTEKYAADLHDLQRVLHLPTLPHRIEGYDISNIHGLEAVGSMVVALDGEPAPSEYRKFKIKTLEGRSNDVGMLREVLARRLAHAPSPSRSPSQREGEKKGGWPAPDLILIDGGRAQLNAALRVFRAYGISIANSDANLRMHANDANQGDGLKAHSQHSHGIRSIRIALVALAKRAEEIYLPGERSPLRLPRNSPALHLLQRIRDEAHRFAISYHRRRYRKRLLHR